MTNDKMFEEIGCPDELKKCKAEIERHKRFIRKVERNRRVICLLNCAINRKVVSKKYIF